MSIKDVRKTWEIIGPCKEMVPKDCTNYIYDITGKDGKVGEIEVGTDGFVQVRVKVENRLLYLNSNDGRFMK